jgi:hypothetical protein
MTIIASGVHEVLPAAALPITPPYRAIGPPSNEFPAMLIIPRRADWIALQGQGYNCSERAKTRESVTGVAGRFHAGFIHIDMSHKV